MQKQLQKIQLVTTTPTIVPRVVKPPIIPFPFLWLPKPELKEARIIRVIKGKPYTKYTPGYPSLVFRWYGKKPKKIFKRYTGFEVRPLLKGMALEKYFAPPKRVKKIRRKKR